MEWFKDLLKYIWFKPTVGLSNLFKFGKVVWNYRNYDYEFFIDLMLVALKDKLNDFFKYDKMADKWELCNKIDLVIQKLELVKDLKSYEDKQKNLEEACDTLKDLLNWWY